jgi:hypothetical protein
MQPAESLRASAEVAPLQERTPPPVVLPRKGGHAMAARKSARKSAGKSTRKPVGKSHAKSGKRWSQHVTETSNAMDLESGVFAQTDPKKIAASLKRSAEHSHRRKSEPYRSAMSMLTFYVNRAGKDLPANQKRRLEAAKGELRKAFGKDSK